MSDRRLYIMDRSGAKRKRCRRIGLHRTYTCPPFFRTRTCTRFGHRFYMGKCARLRMSGVRHAAVCQQHRIEARTTHSDHAPPRFSSPQLIFTCVYSEIILSYVGFVDALYIPSLYFYCSSRLFTFSKLNSPLPYHTDDAFTYS